MTPYQRPLFSFACLALSTQLQPTPEAPPLINQKTTIVSNKFLPKYQTVSVRPVRHNCKLISSKHPWTQKLFLLTQQETRKENYMLRLNHRFELEYEKKAGRGAGCEANIPLHFAAYNTSPPIMRNGQWVWTTSTSSSFGRCIRSINGAQIDACITKSGQLRLYGHPSRATNLAETLRLTTPSKSIFPVPKSTCDAIPEDVLYKSQLAVPFYFVPDNITIVLKKCRQLSE